MQAGMLQGVREREAGPRRSVHVHDDLQTGMHWRVYERDGAARNQGAEGGGGGGPTGGSVTKGLDWGPGMPRSATASLAMPCRAEA